MRPREAKSFKQICRLSSDNHDNQEGWIIIDVYEVTICAQKNGEGPTGKVALSRRSFNSLIDWYNRDQKAKK